MRFISFVPSYIYIPFATRMYHSTGVVHRVTPRAVYLDDLGGDVNGGVGRFRLRHRSLLGDALATVMLLCGVERQQACGLDFGRHIRKLERDALELPGWLTELLAPVGEPRLASNEACATPTPSAAVPMRPMSRPSMM